MAAPGPSLPEDLPKHIPILAVQDAYRRVPWASVLYGCDARWWRAHDGCMDFRGEKWSTTDRNTNHKEKEAEQYGLHLLWGEHGIGFSRNPRKLHYGSNSGFQAINLAILFGCTDIALVGFDFQPVGGKTHFFGEHPQGLGTPSFTGWHKEMKMAAERLEDVRIVNCTPGSALKVFPMGDLDEFANH